MIYLILIIMFIIHPNSLVIWNLMQQHEFFSNFNQMIKIISV